jgi:uncharacterized protein
MKRLRKSTDDPLYIPDYFAEVVTKIDYKKLASDGVEVMAFDADNTLIPFSLPSFKPKMIDSKILSKLQKNRKLFKKWIIASNRPSNDLRELASSLDATVVRANLVLRKPRKSYFSRVINEAGVKPGTIAMVGDKVFADIYGAKKSGLITILVKPLGSDNPLDRIFRVRRLEQWLLRKVLPVVRNNGA